jgi:hydrogenase expression/formation protein HypC
LHFVTYVAKILKLQRAKEVFSMCLGIPGKVIEIGDNQIAVVEIGGVKNEVSLAIVPEAKVGDYIISHAGFAIKKVDEKEALETLELVNDMENQ